jgi:hypothetical protein
MVFKIVESLERRILNSLNTPGDNVYPKIAVISGVTIGGTSYLLAGTHSTHNIPAGLEFQTLFVRSKDFLNEAKLLLGNNISVKEVLFPNETNDKILVSQADDTTDSRPLESIYDNAFLSSVVIIRLNGSFQRNYDSAGISFQLKDSKFVLKKTDKGTVQDIYGHIVDQESRDLDDTPAPPDMKKKLKEKLKKKRISEKAPLDFEIVTSKEMKDLSLKDKVLVRQTVFTSMTQKGTLLWTSLKDAVDKQLALVKDSEDCEVDLLIFFPKGITCHEIAVVYPVGKTDAELLETRRRIHLENFLPLNRPLLRRLNASDTSTSAQLINPHEGLESPKYPFIAITQGRYAYHHYMQDKFNDSGWGCAYRSLQTIVSWFRLQGYTDKKVPTHREIQQALVDCGDKEASFVGSTKWIGSNEVSFVLNELFGITSKMMFVSAGSEMSSKGRELISHFQTQGTPVMIGGGVLAHTIIGVAFDDKQGDTKFLILDPHFTGEEDLSVIQKKGWCSWKPSSFWEKNSFYNMCLPQAANEF